MAAIGLGATIGSILLALHKSEFILFILPTLIIFLVGLGVMINGLWFTVPRKEFPQPAWDTFPQDPAELAQRTLAQNTSPAYQPLSASSVTEHTTHHLSGGASNPKVR